MKLFFYYASHSFVNQVKKLFRSWVAIVIVASLVLGLVVGLGAGFLEDVIKEKAATEPPAVSVPEVTIPPLDAATIKSIVGLAVLGVALLVFLFSIWFADKSGSQIFLMADVNLLFSAPMKPQSVLLFRLMSQIFLMLFIGFWMGFQIPNLVVNAHLPLSAALFGLAAWVFIILYSRLISVLVYTVTATRPKYKKMILPMIVGIVALLGGGYSIYYLQSGLHPLSAAENFFNFPGSNWVPLLGWLKGMVLFAMEEKPWLAAICAGFLLFGLFPLAWGIWHFKADFYEDAMAGAQIHTEKLEAANKNRLGIAGGKSKDRGDNIKRDGLWGSGAQMFFTKTLYNRVRFGSLKVFTKTSLFYLAMAVLFSTFFVFVLKAPNFYIAGFAFCLAVFFRAMGNPLSSDMESVYFQMVPASFHSKVFWSAAGGSVNTFLDLLPAYLIISILLRANPLVAVGIFLLAMALDFYVGQVLLLLDLSMSTAIAPQAKQAISVLFIYFGLLPPVAVLAFMGAFLSLLLGIWIAAASTAAIGFAVFAISPMILDRGRR